MVALKAVQQCFPTKRVQNAVRMAEHLVRMCQRNKLEAAETLSRGTQGVLDSREYSSAPSGKDSRAPVSRPSAGNSLAAVQGNEANRSTAPGEIDQVGLGDLFDWEKFLCSDFAFDLGFPNPYSMSHAEGIM